MGNDCPMKDNFDSVHNMIKQGDYIEAISELVNENSGKIKMPYAWDLNHAWYCVADCKFRLGDAAGAIPAFHKAYRSAPEDVECLLAIGNCYDALKRPRLAERYFRKALFLFPDGKKKTIALVNLGNALLDQKKWIEAIECFSAPSKRKDEIGTIARKNKAFAHTKLGMIS